MTLQLRHYSAQPVAEVESREQSQDPSDKPRGFWVSVDSCEDNWPSWCKAENFGISRLEVAHDVVLRPDARMLTISDCVELMAFDEKFRRKSVSASRLDVIEWARVAQEWQGIIIAPYLWDMRLNHDVFWYYVWDCASGCIWDATAIQTIRQLELTVSP